MDSGRRGDVVLLRCYGTSLRWSVAIVASADGEWRCWFCRHCAAGCNGFEVSGEVGGGGAMRRSVMGERGR